MLFKRTRAKIVDQLPDSVDLLVSESYGLIICPLLKKHECTVLFKDEEFHILPCDRTAVLIT